MPALAVTYEQLQQEAMTFLAHCGELTIKEQASLHNPAGKTSVNEILGMATRVIAEQALNIQTVADEEERRGPDIVINGKYFPMWQQIIDNKAKFVQIINIDMGREARAKLLDIRLEPSGDDMVMVAFDIEMDGKKDEWGATVDHLGITPNNTRYKGLCLSSAYVGQFILQTQEDLDGTSS